MKKKLLLLTVLVIALSCLFAIGVSAAANPNYGADYTEKMTSNMTSVTLVDGTVCPLYDTDGYALCYYNVGNGLESVRAEDMVIEKSGTKLYSIKLSDGTVLASCKSTQNKLVVCNLRHTDITDFSNDNLFKNQDVLQYIFMPDTIVNLLHYVFYQNTNLIGCYFSETSQLQEIKYYTFGDCSKLAGFYLPSGIKYLGRDANGGTGNNMSAFTGCNALYFVDNYDNNPTDASKKPSVYYFPSGLETVSRECFKNCYAINDTIVFPESVTSIPENGWTFAYYTSRKNIVFLGDMTELKSCGDTKNIHVFFANKNTTTSDISLTFSNNPSNSVVYFCGEGKKATLNSSWASNLTAMDVADHLYLVEENTAPTCTVDGVKGYTCFCGLPKEGAEVIPATGHKASETIIEKYFTKNADGSYNYFENMVKLCECTACQTNVEFEMDNTALFATDKGYSFSETDASSFSYTLHVNVDAIKSYLAENTGFKYGVVVSANTAKAPIGIVDGAINKNASQTVVVELQGTTNVYEYVMTKLTFEKDYQGSQLYCQAYAVDNGTISYISPDKTSVNADVISHAILVDKYESKEDLEKVA